MYLTTTTTITAPSLCRINIKNNVLDITVTLVKNSLAIPQILLLDTNYNFRLTNMFGLQNSGCAERREVLPTFLHWGIRVDIRSLRFCKKVVFGVCELQLNRNSIFKV